MNHLRRAVIRALGRGTERGRAYRYIRTETHYTIAVPLIVGHSRMLGWLRGEWSFQ